MMLALLGSAFAGPSLPLPPWPQDLVEDCDALDRLPLDGEVVSRGLACSLRGDLDGDGRNERISLVSTKDTRIPGIFVRFADGRAAVIGAGRQTPILRYDEPQVPPTEGTITSIDWLAGWRIEPRRTRRGQRGPRPRTLRGDALWVTGTDAAVLWFFDGQQLCEYALGY